MYRLSTYFIHNIIILHPKWGHTHMLGGASILLISVVAIILYPWNLYYVNDRDAAISNAYPGVKDPLVSPTIQMARFTGTVLL